MTTTRTITVQLDDGTPKPTLVDGEQIADVPVIAVVAEPVGGTLVSDTDVVMRLESLTGSIETVSRSLLNAVKKVGPQHGEVEVSFGLAIEAGQLVALLGKAKGEASIRVLLGWGSKP